MIPAALSLKLRRIHGVSGAERSLRRGPASANSLGRVVPAAWTAAGLASAASPWGKPAGAGCAPFACAARSGFPGLLNGGRGACEPHFWRRSAAFIFARILTSAGAGLFARQLQCLKHLVSHPCCKCPLTVCGDTFADTRWRSRGASPGWAEARSGSRGQEVHDG